MTADDGVWRSLGLAAPARRALMAVGIRALAELARWTRSDVAALHGMGPNALSVLDAALMAEGLGFARERR